MAFAQKLFEIGFDRQIFISFKNFNSAFSADAVAPAGACDWQSAREKRLHQVRANRNVQIGSRFRESQERHR